MQRSKGTGGGRPRKTRTRWTGGRLALALVLICGGSRAGTNDCLPGWSGQLLVPTPSAGAPGWNVESDAILRQSHPHPQSGGHEPPVQLEPRRRDWVQARYDFSPPRDLSTADLLGVTLRGDSNAPANTVTIMCVDTNDVFYGYDFPGPNRGLNQVTRWLAELPVPKKAFRYFWGGAGGNPPLDWSNIRKLFVVVKRPAPGGGGSGRLWIGPLQYDRAANWPRPTHFVVLDPDRLSLPGAATNAIRGLPFPGIRARHRRRR